MFWFLLGALTAGLPLAWVAMSSRKELMAEITQLNQQIETQ